MTRVAKWVQDLCNDCPEADVSVGERVTLADGRRVQLLEGVYWGEYGLSNWWTWRVLKTGKKESGYLSLKGTK